MYQNFFIILMNFAYGILVSNQINSIVPNKLPCYSKYTFYFALFKKKIFNFFSSGSLKIFALKMNKRRSKILILTYIYIKYNISPN
jgi:hypothetical protein